MAAPRPTDYEHWVWTPTFRGLEIDLAENVPVARDIARIYRIILADAITLDATGQNTWTRLLIESLWFYLYGPLKDVWQSADLGLSKSELMQEMTLLNHGLYNAEVLRSGGANAARDFILTLPDNMQQTRQITTISPMELLVRLCFYMRRPQDLGLSSFFSSQPFTY